MQGGQIFEIDGANDMVRVTGGGMWTPQDARAHFAEIEQALRPLRAQNRRLIFLIDMRQAVVQSRETALAMHSGAMRMHRSTDIVAVVTASALHAMQVKSVSQAYSVATFYQMDEALDWIAAQRCHA